LKETHLRCPNKAIGPDFKFCGKHKKCHHEKIAFAVDASPKTIIKKSPQPKPIKPTSQSFEDRFSNLSKFDIQHLCETLMDHGQQRTLANLIQSSKGFRDVCQRMLRDWYKHLEDEPPTQILQNGTKYWKKNGQFHREGDLPALIGADGTQVWFINGQRHRVGDKPAVIGVDGERQWFINGQRHREGDQPAIIWADGRQEWWINNQRHREGDQPAIINADGTQEWWVHGHRIK
jgi:hypothetical protein